MKAGNSFEEITLIEQRKSHLWINPEKLPSAQALAGISLGRKDMEAAETRLRWFAPLLARLFSELEPAGGIIESDLIPAPAMASALPLPAAETLSGSLWVKADHDLPVAGSVKARGGDLRGSRLCRNPGPGEGGAGST